MTSHQANLARINSTYGVKTSDTFDGDINELHAIKREDVWLNDFLAAGGTFSRIRLVTDSYCPFLDISYVYGQMNGVEVRVNGLDGYKMTKRFYRSNLAAQIKAAGGSYKQIQQAWKEDSYAIMWG